MQGGSEEMWHCTIYRLHIGYRQHRVDNEWGEGVKDWSIGHCY